MKLLGRPFSYCLQVVHGRHLGTTLGTPTLNQWMPGGLIVPRFGVYASRAMVDGKWYPGVTNVGVKPTVGSEAVVSETWLPHFSGDLYGRSILVELLRFIRPEQKFAGLEELKQAIFRDGATAEQIVSQMQEDLHPKKIGENIKE